MRQGLYLPEHVGCCGQYAGDGAQSFTISHPANQHDPMGTGHVQVFRVEFHIANSTRLKRMWNARAYYNIFILYRYPKLSLAAVSSSGWRGVYLFFLARLLLVARLAFRFLEAYLGLR